MAPQRRSAAQPLCSQKVACKKLRPTSECQKAHENPWDCPGCQRSVVEHGCSDPGEELRKELQQACRALQTERPTQDLGTVAILGSYMFIYMCNYVYAPRRPSARQKHVHKPYTYTHKHAYTCVQIKKRRSIDVGIFCVSTYLSIYLCIFGVAVES